MIEIYEWMRWLNKEHFRRISRIPSQERTRSSSFKLNKFRVSRDIGGRWFGNIFIDKWNKLPDRIDFPNTLETFKYRLHGYMSERGCK